ncbi:hypothetical protein AJ78_04607 [Emergomyces pasteurianus Ep9510]|uniref:Uncharacterized protein n=1 Tax=Emergomyces pasteurianus Ep9510 TaxID=1447872 RepID=A0A1J9PGT5_9EURO|nr:hypothetical protein AJ78_04607 [Emergomyces pasteurianus Ep9510]
MSSLSAKRQREDDFEAAELDSERDRKKPRPLPFRTSPTSKHTTLFSQTHQFFPVVEIPATITPVESSDDDENGTASDMVLSPRSQTGKKDDMSFLSIRVQPCSDADSDLEMTDQPLSSSNPISPCSTAGLAPTWPGSAIPSPIPHRLITQSLNISAGRTATPIYGHFTANMSLNAMRQSSNMANDPSAVVPYSAAGSTSSAVTTATTSPSTASLPASAVVGEDWWRHRRLPSPISEDEISPTTTFPQVRRHLKTKTNTSTTGASAPPPCTHAWERKSPKTCIPEPQQQSSTTVYQRHLNHNIFTLADADAAGATGGSSTLAIPAHNHIWSIGNNPHKPTWFHQLAAKTTAEPNTTNIPPVSTDNTTIPQREQTGRSPKISIAMGYRADCDKCQRRVPGHYSHIIRG